MKGGKEGLSRRKRSELKKEDEEEEDTRMRKRKKGRWIDTIESFLDAQMATGGNLSM